MAPNRIGIVFDIQHIHKDPQSYLISINMTCTSGMQTMQGVWTNCCAVLFGCGVTCWRTNSKHEPEQDQHARLSGISTQSRTRLQVI